MGQAQVAKFERRQIRRVIGDDVPRLMQAFEQRIRMTEVAAAEDRKRLNVLESDLVTTGSRLNALERWQMLGFWGRLRWLLRGK